MPEREIKAISASNNPTITIGGVELPAVGQVLTAAVVEPGAQAEVVVDGDSEFYFNR